MKCRQPSAISGAGVSKQSQTEIIIGLQNIRSLFNKLNFINNLLIMDNTDLLFLTETWLHTNITNSMININNFDILRSDRLDKRGGGVALYHKKSINIQELTKPPVPPTYSNFEFMCVHLDTSNTNIRLLCFYIPPDSSKCHLTIINICKIISFFLTTTTPFIILGDFNLPKINWKNFSSEGKSSQIFLDFCINNALTQCIPSATHKDGNTLDLVICNLAGTSILISSSVECPISSSCDHNLISLTLSASVLSFSNSSYSYPNFKKANFDNINHALSSYNWNLLLNQPTLQLQYNVFISVLISVIDNHVPYVTHSKKSNNNLPKHIKKLLRSKLRTYRLLKSGKCSKEVYKSKASEYEKEVSKWHDKIEESICSNPRSKKLYSYANKKLNNHFTLPPLINSSNETVSSDTEKANLLNQTFHDHFTVDDDSPFSPLHKFSSPMPDFQITAAAILKAVRSSNDKLSLTPERVPAYFIKRVINSILHPLLIIFNNSLKFNFIPKQWKQSIISPIFKKGDKRNASNYRPVAQTSSFGRIQEAILSDIILDHTTKNNLLLPNQFGFLPNRSANSQLLHCLDKWYSSYCLDKIEFVTYTDISKAFDSVSHSKLIKVLQSFGISSALTDWIRNFLTDRTQTVRINDSFSSPLPILSGVPQGSVLGPLLFVLFINDIVQLVELQCNANFALFADDAKIFTTDTDDLQSSLLCFDEVLTNFQLKLAPHKCFVLPICKKRHYSAISSHQAFTINSTNLPFEQHAKDLGIYIARDLKWEQHISRIVQAASFTSYQITKSFRTKNIRILIKLFNSYVRPKLEYNTPVWSPYLSKDIDAIENVQARYTKIICRRCSIPFSSYSDRLSKLNLLSLRSRRIRFDLITLFKIINNMSDLSFDSFFKIKNSPYPLRGGSSKIQPKHRFDDGIWVGSFFERAPRYWNKLSHDITSTTSLDLFKTKLKSINYEDLLEPKPNQSKT